MIIDNDVLVNAFLQINNKKIAGMFFARGEEGIFLLWFLLERNLKGDVKIFPTSPKCQTGDICCFHYHTNHVLKEGIYKETHSNLVKYLNMHRCEAIPWSTFWDVPMMTNPDLNGRNAIFENIPSLHFWSAGK